MHPTDKAARVAGAVYLSLVLSAPFSLLYVPGKLIVRGDATATANNILAHETMFRLAIIGELFGSVIFILLGLALYRLLNGVNRRWALTMLVLVLVSAAVGFLNVLNNVAALTLFRGADFLAPFEKPQRDALAYLFIRLHSQGQFMNEIFWGLWLLPFGLLVYRSGFLPRFLGVWLMLACFGWLVLSLIALLLPPYYEAAFRIAQPVMFAELAIMLWLLVKGAKTPSSVGEGVAFPGKLAASPTIR
ncbi:MAG: DUF4386 domain-containing protein [Chthoniobacterales bacterium]